MIFKYGVKQELYDIFYLWLYQLFKTQSNIIWIIFMVSLSNCIATTFEKIIVLVKLCVNTFLLHL